MAILATAGCCAFAQGQMRVMSWNVAKMVGDDLAIEDVLALAHADDKPGFAVPVDVFAFQEVPQSITAALLAAVQAGAPAGSTYAMATFTTASGEDSAGGAQCLIYRTQSIAEVTAGHVDISTGASRYSDRWKLRLVGYDSNAAFFYVYGSHLKASTGSTNEAARLAGAQALRTNSDALPANTHLIFVGDYNVYSNAEPAFERMLQAGNNPGIDTYGGGPWDGVANAIKHTQSPRTVTDVLVGGGMDDRFDLHLPSPAMTDGAGISIIAGSLRPFGNDGNHYNGDINAGNNTYYPTNIARSNTLADALFGASDHIPVLVDYTVPARLFASLTGVPARVIEGAVFPVTLEVSNAANCVVSQGADELTWLASATGNLEGAGSGVLPGLNFAEVELTMSAPTVGAAYGTVTVLTNSQMAFPTAATLEAQCAVVRHAVPTLVQGQDITIQNKDVELAGESVPTVVDIPVWNFGWNTQQASCWITTTSLDAGTDWSASILSTSPITSGQAAVRLTIPAGSTAENGTLRINVFEESIPGQTSEQLVVSINIAGGQGCPIPADLDCDGLVGGPDLAILLSVWGTDGSAGGDITGDGLVAGDDLGALLGSWGQ